MVKENIVICENADVVRVPFLCPFQSIDREP